MFDFYLVLIIVYLSKRFSFVLINISNLSLLSSLEFTFFWKVNHKWLQFTHSAERFIDNKLSLTKNASSIRSNVNFRNPVANQPLLLPLISPECVSLCLVFESEVQHSKSHEHVFYPFIKQKMTALILENVGVIYENSVGMSQYPNSSYQTKTSWEPVISISNSLFGLLIIHRAPPARETSSTRIYSKTNKHLTCFAVIGCG